MLPEEPLPIEKQDSMETQAGGTKGKKKPSEPRFDASTKYLLDGLFGRHIEDANRVRDLLPNAFIIGAAKSGTTTLAYTLKRHPEIFRPQLKEPKFFGEYYLKGWDWYASLFEDSGFAKVRMEASVKYASGYEMFNGTPMMIKAYIEKPKFIYLVRHPMERIVSYWRHNKGKNPNVTPEFNESFDDATLKRYYVESSMYWMQISRYRELFDDSQILLLTFEDMIGDPEKLLRTVLQFLEVSDSEKIMGKLLKGGKFVEANSSGTGGRDYVEKPTWNPEVYEKIREIIAPDAKAFLAHIGKPADYWSGL
jgi:hypothetical protein